MIKGIRKITFLVLILWFSANSLYSQAVLGIHGGINLAALNGSKIYDDNTYRVGITAYAYVEIPFNYIVSLETGVGYSNKGMHHEIVIPDYGATNTLKVKNHLDYVVVPVYIKENFSNFYTKIGPYGAYLLNARSYWENIEERAGVLNTTSGMYENFADSIRIYDVGISIGIGFINYLPKKRKRRGRKRRRKSAIMQIDARYDLGFFEIDATGRNESLNLKNRVFTLGISLSSIFD